MGDLISLSDYRKDANNTVANTDRTRLHGEFSKAACFLFWIDPTRLAQEEGAYKDWDGHPTITTNLGRARFAYIHAHFIADQMERIYGSIDVGPMELEACARLEHITREIYADLVDGVALPVIRKEWDRAVNTLIDDLTGQALNQLHPVIRIDVPDPRNG
jgi:hypothetical protein